MPAVIDDVSIVKHEQILSMLINNLHDSRNREAEASEAQATSNSEFARSLAGLGALLSMVYSEALMDIYKAQEDGFTPLETMQYAIRRNTERQRETTEAGLYESYRVSGAYGYVKQTIIRSVREIIQLGHSLR